MIEINEINLINTVDKSPYVWDFDTDVFNVVTPATTEDTTIDTLELKLGSRVLIDSCFKAYLEYDLDLGDLNTDYK